MLVFDLPYTFRVSFDEFVSRERERLARTKAASDLELAECRRRAHELLPELEKAALVFADLQRSLCRPASPASASPETSRPSKRFGRPVETPKKPPAVWNIGFSGYLSSYAVGGFEAIQISTGR